MYSFKKINGIWHVIHDESGCSLPYHRKLAAYYDIIHKSDYGYKLELFWPWFKKSNTGRKKMFMDSQTKPTDVFWTTENFSIANVQPNVAPEPINWLVATPQENPKVKGKKKGTTMYYDDCDCCNSSSLSPEKRHLVNRVNEVYNGLEFDEVAKVFNLRDDDPPSTPNEFVQRIKDGKITVQKDKGDASMHFGYILQYIRWRDPAVQPDEAGAKKAREALHKLYNETMDTVMVSDLDKGLTALKEFEQTDVSSLA